MSKIFHEKAVMAISEALTRISNLFDYYDFFFTIIT